MQTNVNAFASGLQNRELDPLELELKVIVHHPSRVLRTKVCFFARAVSDLNLQAISPTSIYILKTDSFTSLWISFCGSVTIFSIILHIHVTIPLLSNTISYSAFKFLGYHQTFASKPKCCKGSYAPVFCCSKKYPFNKNVKKCLCWINQNEACGFLNHLLLILMSIIFLLAQLQNQVRFHNGCS